MRAADTVTETLDVATRETAIQEIGTHVTWAVNPENQETEDMVDARVRRICRESACTTTETTATSKTRES